MAENYTYLKPATIKSLHIRILLLPAYLKYIFYKILFCKQMLGLEPTFRRCYTF